MPFQVLIITDATEFANVLEQIDNKLTISYAGSPVSNVAGKSVGQLCINTVNEVIYKCTATDGTIVGSVWSPIGAAAYATETTSGVIELATDAEVSAGIDETRAVVSAYLKNHYSRKDANLADLDDVDLARANLNITLANLGLTAGGIAFVTAANDHDALVVLGATPTGEAVFNAVDAKAARAAVGIPLTYPLDDATLAFLTSF